MKNVLWAISALLLTVSFLTAEMDSSYKSWEVKDQKEGTYYIRFRINIPFTIKYVEERIAWLENQLKTEKSQKKIKTYSKNVENYKVILNQLKSGKVKQVCVFGDFNAWTTFSSEIPNKLEKSSNPDTWYAKAYVPIVVNKGDNVRYKFVIDMGKKFKAADGSEQEYVYIEDPRNPNKSDDGFGGYNSFFKAP